MKYSPSAVTIERVGKFVELMVGPSRVRMTPTEAEQMVQAIERALEEPPKRTVTVH